MKDRIGEPYWSDRPVIIVAGGPSLRGFDFARLATIDAWLVGVNESIFCLPRCDCGVSVDRVFVNERHEKLEKKISGGMEMVIALGVNGSNRPRLDATYLARQLTGKLSDKSNTLQTCGTSGYGALGVAYLKRAKRILLLGYDYSANGEHHHSDYEWHKPPKRAHCWDFWARFYDSTRPQLNAAKIEVFNASPKSAITAFRKGSIEEGLQWVKHAQAVQTEASIMRPVQTAQDALGQSLEA